MRRLAVASRKCQTDRGWTDGEEAGWTLREVGCWMQWLEHTLSLWEDSGGGECGLWLEVAKTVGGSPEWGIRTGART